MEQQYDELGFDDPALKGAIQRAWGAEHVPQRLRGRVSHLIATAGSVDETAVAAASNGFAWARWRERVYGFAAATVIVLGVGSLVLYYQGVFDRYMTGGSAQASAYVAPSKTQVPLALAQSMVATHAACGKLHDHHLIQGVVGNNYAALNVKLTADLGFPALARSIGSDWTFKGAGECTVGELRGSHLLFARGDETISLFSLPSHCMSGARAGAQFDGLVNGSPVAGFARSGAVYAVVGSSPTSSLSLEAVAGIRDTLFNVFDTNCGDEGLAELALAH
jgi:hypothetical protein